MEGRTLKSPVLSVPINARCVPEIGGKTMGAVQVQVPSWAARPQPGLKITNDSLTLMNSPLLYAESDQ
jgi:hypothetical protein